MFINKFYKNIAPETIDQVKIFFLMQRHLIDLRTIQAILSVDFVTHEGFGFMRYWMYPLEQKRG